MNTEDKRSDEEKAAAIADYVVPSYAPQGVNKLVRNIKWAKIVVFSLFGTALVLGLWGHSRWIHATNARLASLEAMAVDAPTPRPQRYDEAELAGLPPAVRRYLASVLNPNQPIVRRVYLEQTGAINRGDGKKWEPFAARQRVTTKRPGFVWDAAVSSAMGLTIQIRNTYVAGLGSLQPSVIGLFDVGGREGTGDNARDDLIRYFAESVWYPTALLPSQGVQWAMVDAQTAKATLTDGALTVSLLFTFNAQGLVERITSTERRTLVNGALVSTPWEVTVQRYETHGGMLVPQEAEAAWLMPAGRQPYWRAKLEKLDYELPR